MNGEHIFATCDDCGCTIAKSDNPPRPTGSAGGFRLEGEKKVRTVEIHCPECWSVVKVDLPDGVSATEMYGVPTPYPAPEEIEGGPDA